jgi:hypothetical protein
MGLRLMGVGTAGLLVMLFLLGAGWMALAPDLEDGQPPKNPASNEGFSPAAAGVSAPITESGIATESGVVDAGDSGAPPGVQIPRVGSLDLSRPDPAPSKTPSKEPSKEPE